MKKDGRKIGTKAPKEVKPRRGVSRREALALMGAGAAAGGSLLFDPNAAVAQSNVRKKVNLSYWTWADNPSHQKRLVDAVDAFNKENGFITIELDASSITMEARNKVVVAYAAGTAPDISGTVQTHAQDWYNTGILHPIDEFFQQWEDKDDYFPNVVDAMRSKPGQPVLYLPIAILPYVCYYRADLFDKAGLQPPATYEEFISDAKALTNAPDVYGYALRGLDYYAVQPIEPIHRSAGVKFVDEDGNVDFDSPEAVAITEEWVGMFTKDKSCQPTAVNDRYVELFALMEAGKGAMWIYGAHSSPQLDAALGDRIQATRIPTANGGEPVTLANPEGNFIVSTCPEKEAAWEFLRYMSNGDPSISLGPQRGLMPVRKSLTALPIVQDNRFFKVASAEADHWWRPPYHHEYWANYQDKIAPYWQETLREEISVQDFHDTAAAMLRGEA
jgi:multiple sugar transport system substrate-binding protein